MDSIREWLAWREADASRIAELEAALTPSAETKAAYTGEFRFLQVGEYGETRFVTVPWTTIKEIMKAISARAALGKDKG